MDLAVLGPLRVRTEHGSVEIAGAKERLVLARLVAAAGTAVSVDDIADALWGDDPPRSAAKSVQNYVLRLRKALEPDRDGSPRHLLTDGAGYRLDVPDDAVDSRRFERLVELGRRAMREGRAAQASLTLAQALALWRGPAYAGIEGPLVVTERLRLAELRLSALEDRISVDLELDRARECVPELEALVREHPLRERLWELLVLALYRSGRQADALKAYARARDTLVDELGVDPGPRLRELQARVLAQDDALAAPSAAPLLPPELQAAAGVFVGRDHELEVLRRWWRQGQDMPATVVVRGAPGTGVRRLVAQLATEVAQAGHAVVLDAAPAPSTVPALRVVRDPAAVPPPAPGLTVVLARPGSTVPLADDVLDVPALAPADVLAILRTYLDEDAARAALPEVVERSLGRPGLVHDLAVQVAREQATARVGSAAAAAVAGQRTLDAARADLREGVSELGEVLDRTVRENTRGCPWKGLASYDVHDAPLFAGRERLVAELVARLATSPVLTVVGSSGSGKSSLVRAGLVAGLRDGVLPGSEAWTVLVMRPGGHPLRELARVALEGREPAQDQVADLLRRVVLGDGEGGRLVLVVDQAEELFTVCDDEERDAFLDIVLDLVSGESRASLVLVVRSDYAGELADRPRLAAALSGSAVLVGAPTEAEVRRAVELPARRAGLLLDVGLTDALVADAGDRPGVLPMLSTALAELWEHRSGNRLTLARYATSGGVSGAVARLAERAYESLDDDGRAGVRVLMLRLAGSGENQAVVRRRVPLVELAALPDARVREVVEPLADARLLTLHDLSVEVAHEALFVHWPRLRAWLEEDAAARTVRARLATAAVDWADGGRERGDLWRGARLAAASELLARPDELTPLERDFVETARAELEAERRDAERRAADVARRNTRLRRLLGALAVLLLVSAASGVMAVRAGARAEREALVAEGRELAAASAGTVATDPELAVLLALEAVQRTRSRLGEPLPEAVEALHLAVTSSRVVLTVEGLGGRVDWSPDGTLFVTEGPEESGLIDLRDTRNGRSVRTFRADDVDVNMARFSSDGSLLASAGDEGALRVWRAATGELLHELPGAGEVWSPHFGPDGRTVAAVWYADGESVVRVWDLATEELVRELPMTGIKWAMALSPDGTRVAAPLGDPAVVAVSDVATGGELFRLEGHEWEVADIDFSPDGRWISTTGGDQTARLWDAASGALVHTLTGHGDTVVASAWSPDSRRLATGAGDGAVRVWEVSDAVARPQLTLSGRGTRRGLYDVVFSPDGRHVMTGDEAVTTVSVFDVTLEGDAEWANFPGNAETDWPALDFAPDGQLFAGSGPGTVTAWDVDTGRATARLSLPGEPGAEGSQESVRMLAVSPDGALVAGAPIFTDAVTVWDARSGEVVFSARPGGEARWASWSDDGSRLAVSGTAGSALVVDRTGRTVAVLRTEPDRSVTDATFAPGGRTLAAITLPWDRARPEEYDVVLWDVESGEVLRRVTGPGPMRRLAYSPDGTVLAVGSFAGSAHLLDASTLTVRHVLEGHSSHVTDVDISPDGRYAATSSGDGTVRIWDIATGVTTTTLRGHRSTVGYVDFGPDGTRLATAGADGVVRVWALDVDDLMRMAQDAVTRDLTDDECRQFLHVDPCPAP